MGSSTIRAGIQTGSEHVVNGTTDDTIIEKRTLGRKLLTVLDGHQSIEDNINRNESLSQAGKLEALKKLGTNETAPSLKWVRPEITRLQEKKARYERQFYTVTSGIEDPAVRMPTFVYLWTKFDPMDQSARIKQFCLSAEQDQVVLLSAMLEHPLGPMIDEEVKQRGLAERAKRLFPNDFTNYEQNQILLEFLTMARDWISRWLREEVGVDSSVIRVSLGDEDALTGIPAGV